MKHLFLVLALSLLAVSSALLAQENLWQIVPEQTIKVEKSSRRIVPRVYQTARLDVAGMNATLREAPMWLTAEAQTKVVVLTLPMPDGTFERFRIENAPCMAPELARKFPEIISYAGVGIDDPGAYLRGDLTPHGFHAMILGAKNGAVFIDPYSTEDDDNYVVYYKKDYWKDSEWECLTAADGPDVGNDNNDAQRLLAGDCMLRVYSLALACTGEYATFHGGTVPLVAAAMNTSMARVNGVFEKDASVHMDLVANNDTLIFLNAATDPYTNSNGSTMLGENQTTCDARIGNANYDIGHVFSTGGGGVAYLGAVCSNTIKAGGVTGQSSPIGDPFDIDYVAHEMGHQYGANHTQNNNCNRNAATAMEPGSASTIMGYAGICSPNVQNNSDAYFHAISLQEIAAEVTGQGNSCATVSTMNNQPTANAGADYTIPKSTFFVLTGTGTDPDPNDVLYYCWEQMDNAVATMPPVATNTGGPAFRSLTPTTSNKRYFPNLTAILANTSPTWEVLPSVGRTLNFRLTVRDNRVGGGCTKEDNMIVTVSAASGPFLVTAPNTAVSWPALSTQTITWDVANTTAAPVSAANVDILLSTDGGLTYPITLASATPNDGTQTLTIPDNQTTTARIMVKGTGNIFFDVSNSNFTISAPLNDFTFDVTPNSVSVCQPADAVYTVNIGASGSFTGNVTLATTGLPAGATATFSQNPVVAPGTSTLTVNTSGVAPGSYSFTVTATGSTGTKSETVGLVVANAAPVAATLTAPANGATGVAVMPTFTWATIADAASYDLQVSTSNLFGSTVINQTGLTAATYTATSALNTNTVYYWRARGINACGTGAWSAVFSFTTVNITCSTYASTDVPKTIPTTVATITSTLTIPAYGTVTDVNLVNLNITHTWINDLIVKLKNPAGTERTMLSQICGSQDNIITNFDDEASNAYSSLPCPPTGNLFYKPLQTLDAFDNAGVNGVWTLTVQDVATQDGGTLNSWSVQVCYTAPAPPTVTVAGTNVLCNGANNGSATATASGGIAPYTYVWSNAATGATITNLAPGTYTVTVTDAASGTGTASVVITQPTVLTVSMSSTPASGGNNGTATATPAGGTAPYGYDWSNGDKTQTITNLAPGTYTVTVIDFNQCTTTGSVVVGGGSPLAVTISSTNVSCNGGTNGSATATATGGTAPYTYAWSNGATKQTISNLAAGTYTVTVTDAAAATATASVAITQPTALAVSITAINIICNGGNNGSATATATGGTVPYTYAWSNGATMATISGLAPGAYTVTATDANGCTATSSTTIAQPPAVVATISSTNVLCFGQNNGTATASAIGGTGSKTYLWSNGATTAAISGLAPGTYTVTASDTNGCTGTASVSITQPTVLTATASSTNPTCNGYSNGTATATATGGTAPYSYIWSNGATTQTATGLAAGTYTVTVADANQCTKTASVTLTQPAGMNITFTIVKPTCFGGSNGTAKANSTGGTNPKTYLWSNGQTTQTATGLAVGSYTVTITDAGGCTKSATATVTGPTAIAIAFTKTSPACTGQSNGSIKATATGGTGSKTYLWSNGQTTQTATGLAAGTYTVTATDTKGCTSSASTTLADPALLQITGFASAPSGSAYRVTVTATGGTGTKKYRRSTGPGTWTALQTSNIFTGVAAGTYTFEVQDAKLCTASAVQAVPVVLSKPAGQFEFAEKTAQVVDFQLAPNPASSSVQLIFAEKMPADGLIEIADATGKLLSQTSVSNLAANGGRLSLAGISAGVAIVTVRAEGMAPASKRLIVQ